MQRNLVLLLLAILLLAVVTAVSQAQVEPPPPAEEEPIIIENPAKQMTNTASSQSQGPIGTLALLTPLSLAADEPSDSCGDAPLLIVAPDTNDGSSADISFATEDAGDPTLACLWGNPTRSQGYRTVWYRLIAPVSGRVTISTFSSGYDTVVAVYSGTCDDLTALHCSDDQYEFTSEATVTITEGETYYVEIADWQPGLVPSPVMQLSVLLQPVDSKWDLVTSQPATPAISRHAVVAHGEDIYVIGGQSGQTNAGGQMPMSNRLLKFNTGSGMWDGELNVIPGAGYSNTTAALVNGVIYLPSGYNGAPSYDGIHWAYNIGEDSWDTVDPVPTLDGDNFAWASAVVPPAQNRYYLTGGISSTDPFTTTGKVSSETYTYLPPPNDQWLQLKPMQSGRYAHTAGWLESSNLGVCVAGGLGVDADPETGESRIILQRSAECYQPGGSWHYIGDLNIPRYEAGSVVGPDGRWYVYGGITSDNRLATVAQTEVYDPLLKTWSILDPTFNLGTFGTMPARSWPRGAMVGNDLWVVGGSIYSNPDNDFEEQALPVINRLYIPSQTARLPVIAGNYDDGKRPDDTFAQARPLTPGTQQTRNFDQQRDFVDFYYFDLNPGRRINIYLDVPNNNDFDLELYGQNKLLRGSSKHPFQGADEQISLVTPTLRYYIAVRRVTPTGQPDKDAYYTIRLE